MSLVTPETLAPTTAEPTPPASPESVAPVVPSNAPGTTERAPLPRTAAEARQRARDAAAGVIPSGPAPEGASAPASPAVPSGPPPAEAPTATIDATGRVHGPDGKFVSPATLNATLEGTSPQAAANGDSPGSPVDATADTPQAATNGDSPGSPLGVRIELPADHPLRGMGLDAIDARPEQERAVRALLNGYMRRTEVEAAQRQAAEVQRQLVELQAERAAEQEFFLSTLSRPEIAAHAADLEQAYGAEAKQRYLAGLTAEMRQQAQAKAQEARTQFEQQRATEQADAAGRAFFADVHALSAQTLQQAGLYVPPHMDRLVYDALGKYGAHLEYQAAIGSPKTPTHAEAYEWVAAEWQRDRDVQAWYRQHTQQQEAERVAALKAETEKELAERERREREAYAKRMSANPHARLPAGAHTGQSTPTRSGARTFVEHRESIRRRANGLA